MRIFIAEDEGIILEGFKTNIEKMGHTVAGVALDGLAAKQKILSMSPPPDMILMDIKLPYMDGLSVLEEVNKHLMIPTIVITGYYSEELLAQANELGVFGYVMKPVDAKQLKATISVAQKQYNELCRHVKDASDLKAALEERKLIERAKGIMMDHFALKESEAMVRLQKMSKDKNKKLAVIAREIIAAEKLLGQDRGTPEDKHVSDKRSRY